MKEECQVFTQDIWNYIVEQAVRVLCVCVCVCVCARLVCASCASCVRVDVVYLVALWLTPPSLALDVSGERHQWL